jgi:hypothetical protein
VAGLGLFAYSRIGDGGDYFDNYPEQGTNSNVPSKESGFRYDPATGKTYNSQTGEIIGSDKGTTNITQNITIKDSVISKSKLGVDEKKD